MSTTAFQLTNKNLLINLNNNSDIISLCWPIKGEDNIFLRTKIFDLIYLDKKKLDISYEIKPIFNLEKVIAKYSYKDFKNLEKKDLSKDIISKIHINLWVDLLKNGFYKYYEFTNNSDEDKQIDLFVIANPDFGSNYSRDTAYFYPDINGIVHYEKNTYLSIFSDQLPYSFACQSSDDFENRGAKGDKHLKLSENPIATGKVETALKYSFKILSHKTKKIKIFFCMGQRLVDVKIGYQKLLNDNKNEVKIKFSEDKIKIKKKIKNIGEKLKLSEKEQIQLNNLYKMSQYLVRGSFSQYGGNFAALDNQYFQNKNAVDDYSYFWPRDGYFAFLACLKDNCLSEQENEMFFEFLLKCFDKNSFLFHRYRLNKEASIGSSWLSWIGDNGQKRLPLQLDETSLSLYVYAKYLRNNGKHIKSFEQKIFDIIEFLIDQVDDQGLHKPCFDLWENHWGVFLSTQLTFIAAFKQARYLVENIIQTHNEQKSKYLEKINKFTHFLIQSLNKYFYNQETQMFSRGYSIDKYGEKIIDKSVDSSSHFFWYLQIKSPDLQIIKKHFEEIEKKLLINKGIARYENDYYLNDKPNEIIGNPWYISTLWFATYYMKIKNWEKAKKYISFVLKHMDQTFLLPEMADPYTGYSLSVKPLIWSHVELLNFVNYNKE